MLELIQKGDLLQCKEETAFIVVSSKTAVQLFICEYHKHTIEELAPLIVGIERFNDNTGKFDVVWERSKNESN